MTCAGQFEANWKGGCTKFYSIVTINAAEIWKHFWVVQVYNVFAALVQFNFYVYSTHLCSSPWVYGANISICSFFFPFCCILPAYQQTMQQTMKLSESYTEEQNQRAKQDLILDFLSPMSLEANLQIQMLRSTGCGHCRLKIWYGKHDTTLFCHLWRLLRLKVFRWKSLQGRLCAV